MGISKLSDEKRLQGLARRLLATPPQQRSAKPKGKQGPRKASRGPAKKKPGL
ncbi:MAG: hypothetical protein WD688_01725 [Candidatus Binatia bacterium]